ncbi:unnamed protein product (macronuclear) [Paramecium tetraurelia]|uniref:Protein-tyrosine-phosphatase n=1 Tax=Paramecium tetraurelia TaxID=5888 RepID=A0E2X8_PARTE|nr:uncharacterized protein GSPATT00022817001 [Paramecium tetraurelia]CAK89645.1 unnamed protein product [Paramecium tetraurelia]|eukprot:XP_001457042.1 hypothetical protein (macronuclear) [Paramecium tetraurelia strain d4-2]
MSKWLDLGLTCTQISFKTQQSVSYSPMNCVFELDGRKLYLGNINAANDSSYLRKHDVGAVLSVIDTSDIKLEKSVIHLWIAAEDCEKVQLIRYFDQASNFIQDNLRHTNVLVHCYAGISRSSSLIIAYLLKCQGYSLKEALTKLKCQRPQVDPNDGFLEQLKQYEEKLKQSKTRPNSSLNKSDSKYLSLSSSVEKQSSLPKTRQSISNFNIYSNLNSQVTKTNIRNLQLTTTAIPKAKSSFLEKSCSPSNINTQNNSGKTFFSNSKLEDPWKQYQKIKNQETTWNKSILGMKNIYSNHSRQHSLNH